MLSTLRIEDSPFNEQQLNQLKNSIGGLNPAQSQWLSGYLAGRLAESPATTGTPQTLPTESLSIIYATETGNSESIATELAANIQQQGIGAELISMDNFRPASLRKLKHVAFIISTHGEGEPPDEALEFFEFLESKRAARLPELNYRVLALGDSSYPLFCEAGRKLDTLLQASGARPYGPRVECDVDFASSAKTYNEEVIRYACDSLATDKQYSHTDLATSPHLSLVPSESHWSREQPFIAEVGSIQKITGLDSGKDVYHLELSLEGSELHYQEGDALGVWAPNDPKVVSQIIETLQMEPSESVTIQEQCLSISEALTNHLEITRLTTATVLAYANVGGQNQLEASFSRLEAGQQHTYLEQHQLADLVEEHPAQFGSQALADILRPLAPRSYSIASSQQMVDEEVHLTVATVHSNAIGTPRRGVASGLLNHRLEPGDSVKVFLQPNRRFHLPEDQDAPLIMIAAGTGIAPYRAFMQELENRTTSPDSWLIFGNPHLRTDFLYQREWLRWRDTGLLNRIDTAWSRDQVEKRYVQDVVREQAEHINQWLLRGAHVYLCGSLQMGQAVQAALQEALAQQRGIGSDAAAVVLSELRRERRIKRDLY